MDSRLWNPRRSCDVTSEPLPASCSWRLGSWRGRARAWAEDGARQHQAGVDPRAHQGPGLGRIRGPRAGNARGGEDRRLSDRPVSENGAQARAIPTERLFKTFPGRLSGQAGDRRVSGRRPRRSALSFPNDFVAVSRRLAEEVKVEKSDVVFVGYGVVAPEYGWDDYKGLDVRGKTLIMLVNDPPVADPKDPAKLDPAFFKGRAMTYYGRWTYKYEIASEKGAAAAILVHETGPAGYPFEVVKGSWSRENFDIAQPADGPDAEPGRGRGLDHAREGQGAVPGGGRDFEALKQAAATPRFPAGAARTARREFEITNALREVKSRNVIARIEGSDPRSRTRQ